MAKTRELATTKNGFRSFLQLFRHLNQKHFLALLADASFVLLAYLGLLAATWFQARQAAQLQSLNLLGALASASTEQAALVRTFAYQLIALFVLLLLYLVVSWLFTRALIWRVLVGVPRGTTFARHAAKLLFSGGLWMLITLIPLYMLFFQLARIYEKPLVQIASRPTGYAYTFFIQLIIVLLFLLYCHLTNIFYYTYSKTGKMRSVWDALWLGIGRFPLFAKPFGVLFVFFVAMMLVGMAGSLFPDPLKTIVSFFFLLFFSLISRVWYLAVLSGMKH